MAQPSILLKLNENDIVKVQNIFRVRVNKKIYCVTKLNKFDDVPKVNS